MKAVATLMSLVLVMAVTANAAIMEVESNNTIATANTVNLGSAVADAGVLSLGSGTDVDFLAIDLAANDYLTVATTPLIPTFQTPDTYMGLFNAAGDLLVYDDDSGNDGAGNLGSMIQYQAVTAGTYYIAVTGYSDDDFDGFDDNNIGVGHGQVGSYIMTLSVIPVPEPATLSLLAMSGLGLIIRRK
jgi:hypothetical protein